jgi:hypothetical protein
MPDRHEITNHIDASFSGNSKATYAVAMHFYNILSTNIQSGNAKNRLSNAQRDNAAHDLNYWLDRCHRQGYNKSWFLYAQSYKNKFLALPKEKTLDDYFKEALKNDDSGIAAYSFSLCLFDRSQHKRSLDLMHQAANKHNIEAIRWLQEYYYLKDTSEYNDIISIGLAAEEKTAFLLDFIKKLSEWEQDKNNISLCKLAKTALISAEARQSLGIKYYAGYCISNGYLGKNKDLDAGINLMIENHEKLPSYIASEKILFKLISTKPEYEKMAIKIAPSAIHQAEGLEKAELKYETAMLYCSRIQRMKSVKSPFILKNLIREAAKEGSANAKQYLLSPYGKALMRDSRIKSLPTKTTSKKKQHKKNRSKNKK